MKFLYDVIVSSITGLVIGIGIVYCSKSLPVLADKSESDNNAVKEEINENNFNNNINTTSKFAYSKIIDWILFSIVLFVLCAGINQYSDGNFLLVVEALFRTEINALKNIWERIQK